MAINFGPTPQEEPRGPDRWRAGIFVALLAAAGSLIFFDAANLYEPVIDYAGRVTSGRIAAWTAHSAPTETIAPPPPPQPQPVKKPESAPLPAVSASSFIVKDLTTGQVLAAGAEYEPRPMASLTKLMSALVILERDLDWSATTTAANGEVFDTYIEPGRPYEVLSLWRAALVGSSNRAMLSLVDTVAGDRAEFIQRMNEKAREIGLSSTNFADPTGLDPANMSTASDVALLIAEALRHEEIMTTLALKDYTLQAADAGRPIHLWNTNWLLLGWVPHKLPELDGGKTGYIPASGYNFAAKIGDGQGHKLAVVVLGAATNEARFAEARDLAAWTFGNFEWKLKEPELQPAQN